MNERGSERLLYKHVCSVWYLIILLSLIYYLQMSWCAGFGPQFWEGYRSIIPQDEGFLDRKPLYDAYHQLNHYNLFGGGYINASRGHLESVKRNLDAKEK